MHAERKSMLSVPFNRFDSEEVYSESKTRTILKLQITKHQVIAIFQSICGSIVLQNEGSETFEELRSERQGLQENRASATWPRGVWFIFLDCSIPADRIACVQMGQCDECIQIRPMLKWNVYISSRSGWHREVRCAKCTPISPFRWYSKFIYSTYSTSTGYCWVKSHISKKSDPIFFSECFLCSNSNGPIRKYPCLTNGKMYFFHTFKASTTTSTIHRTMWQKTRWILRCERHGFSNRISAMD